MRVSTALRIASIIIVAKAVLIGVVYWRRAEILGHPLHVGAYSWIGLITILAVGLVIAAGVYVAAGHTPVDNSDVCPTTQGAAVLVLAAS